MTEQMTGAQALVRALEHVGVDTVFGIPGGAILPAYDPLYDSAKVRHVLVRHEQGAGHAAEGYAQATGKVGVCMATSGPGATNLVTPIADAYMDSVPIVAITGQVSSTLDRHRCLPGGRHLRHHHADHQAQLPGHRPRGHPQDDHGGVPHRLDRPPGPVLVDIAKDALQATMNFSWPPVMQLPGYRPVTRPHSKQIREAAKLIIEAKRPVLYVGGGVHRAGASAELREFAELTGIPVVTTLMARGTFPDSHPQHMGMPGMHGSVSAVGALQQSDLLIALGVRFDDRVTGKLSTFAPHAKVIHADIDPAEISKNRYADVPIVGDCQEVLTELDRARSQAAAGPQGRLRRVVDALNGYKKTYPLGYDDFDGRLPRPAVRHGAAERDRRPRRHLHRRRRPAPDVGRPVHRLREPGHLHQLRRRRHDGLRPPGRDGREDGPPRQRRSGPSTATAASR